MPQPAWKHARGKPNASGGGFHPGKMAGNCRIVAGGMAEGLLGQAEPGLQGQASPLRLKLLKNPVVVLFSNHNGHVPEVLGCRPNHGGAADVDLFHRFLQSDSGPGDGLLEGVEVDHQHVDGMDGLVPHLPPVFFILPDPQQPPVDLGMKRLDPAAQNLRKSGHLGHLGDPGPALPADTGPSLRWR